MSSLKPTVQWTIEQAVSHAQSLVIPGERHILGITGAPGAGKSTVVEQLVLALGKDIAVAVPMDGFHLANNVLNALGRRERKGACDTFDVFGYAALLRRIKLQPQSSRTGIDRIIYAPGFSRELEEPIACTIPVHPEIPLVITEGNYLLHQSSDWGLARSCIDAVWFLTIPENVRHERLIRRHEHFGKSREDARFWALGSDQHNADLIAATMYLADTVVELH